MRISSRIKIWVFNTSLIWASLHADFAFAQNCSDSTMVQLVAKARKELQDRSYLTLATANPKGTPWNSPVYTAFDLPYRFFWISSKNSQHSQNIAQNNSSSAVFYDSTVRVGTGFGVYMQGHTYELKNRNDIEHGLTLIAGRASFPVPPVEKYQGDFLQRVYIFVPDKIWVNTIEMVNNQIIDARIEMTACMLPELST